MPVPDGAAPGQDLDLTIAYGGIPAEGLLALANMHGERVWFSETGRTRPGTGCR